MARQEPVRKGDEQEGHQSHHVKAAPSPDFGEGGDDPDTMHVRDDSILLAVFF